MISDARGGHVSPGIYTEEKDVTYSAKSLGITSLGLVGETVKGPAFQAIPIEDWSEFVDYFGGTSPEKFKGTNLPKYELPYIAESYLQESKRLNVVRVLGLSGYEAGSAMTITMKLGSDNKTQALVILRSKADYDKAVDGEQCEKARQEAYRPWVTSWEIGPYSGSTYDAVCSITNTPYTVALNGTIKKVGESKGAFDSSDHEMGKFCLTFNYDDGSVSGVSKYNVSLNPMDRDYIYNIFSTDPLVGTAPVYIESVYDYAYNEAIQQAPVNTSIAISGFTFMGEVKYEYNEERESTYKDYVTVFPEVVLKTDAEGKKYLDVIFHDLTGTTSTLSAQTVNEVFSQVSGWMQTVINSGSTLVDIEDYKNIKIEVYNADESGDPTTLKEKKAYSQNNLSTDVTSFNEVYRCAQTPWVISEVKEASKDSINVKKLFKFYTISDGNAANYQVKISIQKIRPDEGRFDVWVRDFYDTDVAPVVLEKFSNLTMVEGDPNYIGLKIGTFDGSYVSKSKYITVLMGDGDGIESCVPCGFLGYPIPTYGCDKRIELAYNTAYNDAIKPKRQYFGLNADILDEDILNYKGVNAYNNAKGDCDPKRLTNGFHLDAILSMAKGGANNAKAGSLKESEIYVDTEKGYRFTTVDAIQSAASSQKLPRLFNEAYCQGTIYEDINLRKFTLYPYGGFDGWDIYRQVRTNEDKYKATKYAIVDGCPFTRIGNTEIATDPTLNLGLPVNAINSDYYAYLAGYMQFANPQDVDINVFATPGIDFGRNGLLVDDALDMVEDPEDGRGGDAIYIITAPQYDGLTSYAYTCDEINELLDDSEIKSSYACTYFPWIKYYDGNVRQYIDLPVTKDVVRNMAKTDNTSYPWFAPAGVERGAVDCVKAVYKTTLADEDTLYEGRINPIKTFAQDGVKIWGNKTLYTKDTPLNRINVRRLMLRVKKLVIDASKSLIFEQYDASLEKQFKSLVEPILSEVKANRGIVDYRVVTECTPETRDQHILPAKILIKPTPALEYISITFTVYPESISFENEE